MGVHPLSSLTRALLTAPTISMHSGKSPQIRLERLLCGWYDDTL